MSNTLFAFLTEQDVPDRDSWQRSIDATAMGLTLDPELVRLVSSDFRPCRMSGPAGEVDAGFEIAYGAPAATFGADWEGLAPGADHCISLSWGGAMADGAAASIAAYALAKDFGAIVSYEGDAPMSLEDQVDGVDGFLGELEQEREQAALAERVAAQAPPPAPAPPAESSRLSLISRLFGKGPRN